MLVINGQTIYVLPGPFMSMHNWSNRTKYDDISGPAGPFMCDKWSL